MNESIRSQRRGCHLPAHDFPETGDYVVTQALSPVVIEAESGQGTYIESNAWMKYEI
jgi:hypothetical protein